VSLCVEPGAGSAVLKFGFRVTDLPSIGLDWSKAMALRTPSFRSEVRTRLTLVPLASPPLTTCELGDVIEEVGLDIFSPLRKQDDINEDINTVLQEALIIID